MLAKDTAPVPAGRAKVRIGRSLLHIRYCSPNPNALARYKFNINPNTLSADYELWICGSAAVYYLMPMSFIQSIYDNPGTYVDRAHPEIRVVSVDADAHSVTYACGGVSSSLRKYLSATLP